MPFYELDNYFENEINNQDVYFLIWYFINTIQESKFISPLNDFIFNSGDNIMEIYEREWENAPINEHLQSFYQIKENETYCFRERAKKDGFFQENSSFDFSDQGENGLVFFNPKSGCEIAFDINSAFPLPNNPFYNKEESEEHIIHLLINENLSKRTYAFLY